MWEREREEGRKGERESASAMENSEIYQKIKPVILFRQLVCVNSVMSINMHFKRVEENRFGGHFPQLPMQYFTGKLPSDI